MGGSTGVTMAGMGAGTEMGAGAAGSAGVTTAGTGAGAGISARGVGVMTDCHESPRFYFSA
jgi:hypothetical protein